MMNTTTTFVTGLLSTMVLTAGCVSDELAPEELDDNLSEIDQEIQSGSYASSWQQRRAVLLTVAGTESSMYCTGTLIASRYVLTAAHCEPMVNERVLFYPSGVHPDESSDRIIDAVYYPSGVYANVDDFTDSSGKFADMAVVRLATAAPAGSIAAVMAWSYPAGGDDSGIKVGAGSHDGNGNLVGLLLQTSDWTYSDHDRDGHFLTENEQTNPGDSGGPFYYGSKVLGTLYGRVFEWEYRNKYTSTPHRLPWILSRIGYAWGGMTETRYRRLVGTTLSELTSTKQTCQYACDNTASCDGYNYEARYQRCTMLSSISGSVGDAYTDSATR